LRGFAHAWSFILPQVLIGKPQDTFPKPAQPFVFQLQEKTMLDSLAYGGRIYSMMPEAELLAAGVPQAVIDAAKAAGRAADIKAECRRRIYAEASQETQANMMAAATVIAARPAEDRSPADQEMLAAFTIAMEWVTAMRANIATLAADAGADFHAEASWPAVPPEAAALAALY
jgi:hypothetical protein